MKKKIVVKQQTDLILPEAINELEFSQPADELLEAINQYVERRDGKTLSGKQRVAIAVQILESRI